MGLGRIIGGLFGRRLVVAAPEPTPSATRAAARPDAELLRLWRARHCLQPARLSALRDAVAATRFVPPYSDAPDPYVPRLRDVDAVLTSDVDLQNWLIRHDPQLRPPGPVAVDSDGLVFGPPECRVRLRLAALAVESLDVTPSPNDAVVTVFTVGIPSDALDLDLARCRARHLGAVVTALSALDHPTTLDLGPSLQGWRLTVLKVKALGGKSSPCAVLDLADAAHRVVLCPALPPSLLFVAPPGVGGPAPNLIVGGLAVRRRRPGASPRLTTDPAPFDPDAGAEDAPETDSFERGLTATQIAARLGRRSLKGLSQRLYLDRFVVLTGARGVDASGSIALATALGLSPHAIGPRVFVPPSAAESLEALCTSGDDSWTAPNDIDSEHVTAAILVGGAPAAVMQRLRAGLAAAAPSAAFARALLHEVDGDTEAAIAAYEDAAYGDAAYGAAAYGAAPYEDAANVDSRADEQLLVLNDRLGVAIPPAELLSDDPPVLPTLNRALLEWRKGRAAVARDALENADVATLSLIGRAVHDELDAGQPASVKLPLVSPALAELVDTEVACAFLRAGEVSIGVALLERALDREPLDAGAAATLATHYIRIGLPESGLLVLARVMRPGPRTGTGLTSWTDGHGLRSEALAQLGRHDEALGALDAMFENTSARLEARLARIALLESLGRMNDARADAARLPSDGADAVLTRRVLARLQHS